MRIICEVCKVEGYLQQLGNYYRVRHYNGKAEYGKSKFYYHQQSKEYAEQQLSNSSSSNAQKTLIKLPHTQIAETDHFGVQIEHLNMSTSGSKQVINSMRDSPSLVWGRPAKSVVERPRGFNSHIPRHFLHPSRFCRCKKQHVCFSIHKGSSLHT